MAGLTKLELETLGRQPYGCPELKVSWRYLKGTHGSVAGLLDALHVVRLANSSNGSGVRGDRTEAGRS